ncbi:AraC family transcriptional regulator [Pyxidicoccus caerfyrddinensis]|uniref:AraC family transcriptional regulator n=1 Tax=Pyxidicoccus caerfyrddinensis TaxID=2709663 RepID=UPI0013DD6429|nr:AraC family transcriptional regulator [Pyxidicoccus caerfyrddinensis]
MDLLSDVLRDLRLESAVLSLGEFRAPWGFDKGTAGGAPFHVVVEGRCLLQVEDSAPIELTPGDLVVLPQGTRHALMSDRRAPRTPFQKVLEANGHDGAWTPDSRIEGLNRLRLGGQGPLTRIINGVFSFRDGRRNPFLEALPTVLLVRGRPSWLEGSLRLLMDEAISGRPGFQTIAERVADIVFVQAVRDHAANLPSNGSGWLRGLTDRQIAHALALVHRRPSEAWTVASLARAVALSRTVFAQRFRGLVGSGVMEYVTARRMHVAAGLLTGSTETLADIANTVGYESEISFSKAFRRWAGVPPGQYRRRANGAPLSAPESRAAAGRASPRRTPGTAPSAARTPRSPRPPRSAR